MSWARAFKILLLNGLLSLGLTGQNPGKPNSTPNQPQNAPKPASPQGKSGAHKSAGPPPYRMGDWLSAHKNLTPDQQEKLLENDPRFKHMTPQRQAELRDWLRTFNNHPPAQRELIINRMQWMARLTPQQRQDMRDANKVIQTFPKDRQLMVHRALRHLRQMDPQERQQEFESDRFKSTFSEQEQGVLTKLATIAPPENNPSPNAGGGNQVPTESPK